MDYNLINVLLELSECSIRVFQLHKLRNSKMLKPPPQTSNQALPQLAYFPLCLARNTQNNETVQGISATRHIAAHIINQQYVVLLFVKTL